MKAKKYLGLVLMASGILFGSETFGEIFKPVSSLKQVYEFQTGAGKGVKPRQTSGFVYDGTYLYGMTGQGSDGAVSGGGLFRIKPDGSGYTVLKSFTVSEGGGDSVPLLIGDYLYCTNSKYFFSIKKDGTEYDTILEWNQYLPDYEATLGYGSLGVVKDGTKFYGFCYSGSSYSNGSVWSCDLDGSNVALLHIFGEMPELIVPFSSPLMVGDYLYGTSMGGEFGTGGVFRIKKDGTGYQVLKTYPEEGGNNYCHLNYIDGKIYGKSRSDGDHGFGTVFTIDPTTLSYSAIYSFQQVEFALSYGAGFLEYGDYLYSSCSQYIYRMKKDGTGVNITHVLSGAWPMPGNLCIAGSYILGMTEKSNSALNSGSVFVVGSPEEDFSGSAKSGLISECPSKDGRTRGYIHDIDGTSSSSDLFYTKSDPAWQIENYADFNGDNRSDILWKNTNTNCYMIYLMNGKSVLSAKTVLPGYSGWRVDAVGDFDGDSKCDLLLKDIIYGDGYMYLMNGTAVKSHGWIKRGYDWECKGIADFNADGKSDILWEIDCYKGYVSLMNGLTSFSMGQIYSRSGSWEIAKFADFNGDSKCDMLWIRTVEGNQSGYIYLMNGTSILSSGYLYSTSDTGWEITHVGDLNFDINDDIVFRHKTKGTAVGYLMDGLTASQASVLFDGLGDWEIVKLLDFNADGKKDLLFTNSSTNKTVNYLMNGLEATSSGVLISNGLEKPILP